MQFKRLHHSKGKFGDITVNDGYLDGKPVFRELRINHQVQGGAYFSPSAADAPLPIEDADGSGSSSDPGPIGLCEYQTALLTLPALQGERSWHVAVAGLGSGSGVVQMLSSSPKMDFTIFEIDPEMVKVAKEFFPLTSDITRLRGSSIIEADFREEVLKHPHVFDAAIMDAYTGTNEANFALDDELLDLIPSWWINAISTMDGPLVHKLAKQMADRGLEVWRIPASTPGAGGMCNVMLIGVAPGVFDQSALDCYVPCEHLDVKRGFPMLELLRKRYWDCVHKAERIG